MLRQQQLGDGLGSLDGRRAVLLGMDLDLGRPVVSGHEVAVVLVAGVLPVRVDPLAPPGYPVGLIVDAVDVQDRAVGPADGGVNPADDSLGGRR